MFNKLFEYAKQLLNEEDTPRDEPQILDQPRQPRVANQGQASSQIKVNMLPQVNLDAPINANQLWNREELHLVLSEKKLEKCYDEKFR